MRYRLLLLVGAVFALALAPVTQEQDEEYARLIKQYLQDPRITTELVDHMPASDTVPSPLRFFGRIPGAPGELTYAKDIHRYYETLAKASPRARFYFSQGPVLNVSAAGGLGGVGGGRGGAPGENPNAGIGQNVTPNAVPLRIQPFEPEPNPSPAVRSDRLQADENAAFRQVAQQFGIAVPESRARVVMQFPSNPNEMLLSGTLAGGEALANRASRSISRSAKATSLCSRSGPSGAGRRRAPTCSASTRS